MSQLELNSFHREPASTYFNAGMMLPQLIVLRDHHLRQLPYGAGSKPAGPPPIPKHRCRRFTKNYHGLQARRDERTKP